MSLFMAGAWKGRAVTCGVVSCRGLSWHMKSTSLPAPTPLGNLHYQETLHLGITHLPAGSELVPCEQGFLEFTVSAKWLLEVEHEVS